MTVYRVLDGLSGRPGVGSSGTQPPASPVTYAGNFQAATAWQVTSWGLWFTGFDWWVPTGGDTAAQKFALWQISNTLAGVLIPAATVTSGTLTAGAMNTVSLATPIPISADVPYLAVTAWSSVHGFPETKSQFGTAGPYIGGITSGPLQAFSDLSAAGGTSPVPSNWQNQGSFGTNSTDPTTGWPNLGSDSSSLFWVGPVVTDAAPAGATYRLRPNTPVPPNMFADTAVPFTLATEFKLSRSCTYTIWFYSPSGAVLLPNQVGIYSQASQTLVSGTLNNAPSWSGAAGSGWVSCAGTVTLPAGSYRVAVCSGPAATVWNNAVNNFWGGGGPASASGIVTGPLTAPPESTADTPGQASYNAGSTIAWPGTYNTPGNGSDYMIDIEVAPVLSGVVPPLVSQYSGIF